MKKQSEENILENNQLKKKEKNQFITYLSPLLGNLAILTNPCYHGGYQSILRKMFHIQVIAM